MLLINYATLCFTITYEFIVVFSNKKVNEITLSDNLPRCNQYVDIRHRKSHLINLFPR